MNGNGSAGSRSEAVETGRRLLHTFWARLLHNGPLKLGALLLAALFWVFVNTDDTLVSQRTLRVPLTLSGLSAAQTVTGAPERVVVRLSGAPGRVAALDPESVDALLDLRGVVGEFAQPVRVFPPQGIGLVSVSPAEVMGGVETRASRVVPVRAATFGAGPPGTVTDVRVSPGRIVVGGAESQVERTTQAIVPVDLAAPAEEGMAYAADAQGNPVAGVDLETETVGIGTVRRPLLTTRRVPLVLEPSPGPETTRVEATLVENDALLVGPSAVLGRLERVAAGVPDTSGLEPGQYTLDATLALPGGVSALAAPQLSVRVRAPRPSLGN